jgi:Na+-translocating ferredoxin:NAD+ oxidoreductase RnfG subunit
VKRHGRVLAITSALCAAALGVAWVVTEAERNKHAVAAQRHHDTVVVHERVVQDLVAAKWAIEAGRPERGLEIVTSTLTQAQDAIRQLRRDRQTRPDGWPGRRH